MRLNSTAISGSMKHLGGVIPVSVARRRNRRQAGGGGGGGGGLDVGTGDTSSVTHFVSRSTMFFEDDTLTGELRFIDDAVAGGNVSHRVSGDAVGSNADGIAISSATTRVRSVGMDAGLFRGTGDHLALVFAPTASDTQAILVGNELNASYAAIYQSGSTETTLYSGQYSHSRQRFLDGSEYVNGVNTRGQVYADQYDVATGTPVATALQDFSTGAIGSRTTLASQASVDFGAYTGDPNWQATGNVVGWARFTDWTQADAVMQAILDDDGSLTPPTPPSNWTLVESFAGRDSYTHNFVETLLEGDLIVFAAVSDIGSGAPHDTNPSGTGWDQVMPVDNGVSPSTRIRYKVVGATPDTSITVTNWTQQNSVGAVFRHPRGCLGLHAPANTQTRVATGNPSPYQPYEVTVDECLAIAWAGVDDKNAAGTTGHPGMLRLMNRNQFSGASFQNATICMAAGEIKGTGWLAEGFTRTSQSDAQRSRSACFAPNPA